MRESGQKVEVVERDKWVDRQSLVHVPHIL